MNILKTCNSVNETGLYTFKSVYVCTCYSIESFESLTLIREIIAQGRLIALSSLAIIIIQA